jgi:uncharacterized protein (TIGR02271 family)
MGNAESVGAAINESPVKVTPAAERKVPIVEESLHVDKVPIDQGGYRISKRVSTRDERVEELLRSQHVEIERRPIGRHLESSEVPEPRHEGDTLIIPVVEEVLVTEKRLLLVEEVRVTRVDATRRDSQSVPLRKEEITIERLAAEEPSASTSSSPPTEEARHERPVGAVEE